MSCLDYWGNHGRGKWGSRERRARQIKRDNKTEKEQQPGPLLKAECQKGGSDCKYLKRKNVNSEA